MDGEGSRNEESEAGNLGELEWQAGWREGKQRGGEQSQTGPTALRFSCHRWEQHACTTSSRTLVRNQLLFAALLVVREAQRDAGLQADKKL